MRINTAYYKDRKKGTILVSLAGPVMNYLLALASMLVYGLFYKWGSGWGTWFYYLAVINGLGTFNLIPLPPLDGSNILELFETGRFYSRIGNMRFAAGDLSFTGILSVPLSRINSAILGGMWEMCEKNMEYSPSAPGAGYI